MGVCIDVPAKSPAITVGTVILSTLDRVGERIFSLLGA